jgi:hypothetical protein
MIMNSEVPIPNAATPSAKSGIRMIVDLDVRLVSGQKSPTNIFQHRDSQDGTIVKRPEWPFGSQAFVKSSSKESMEG